MGAHSNTLSLSFAPQPFSSFYFSLLLVFFHHSLSLSHTHTHILFMKLSALCQSTCACTSCLFLLICFFVKGFAPLSLRLRQFLFASSTTLSPYLFLCLNLYTSLAQFVFFCKHDFGLLGQLPATAGGASRERSHRAILYLSHWIRFHLKRRYFCKSRTEKDIP